VATAGDAREAADDWPRRSAGVEGVRLGGSAGRDVHGDLAAEPEPPCKVPRPIWIASGG
jgi:hypothetical protein